MVRIDSGTFAMLPSMDSKFKSSRKYQASELTPQIRSFSRLRQQVREDAANTFCISNHPPTQIPIEKFLRLVRELETRCINHAEPQSQILINRKKAPMRISPRNLNVFMHWSAPQIRILDRTRGS